MRIFKIIACAIIICTLTSCASIISGLNQKVDINSTPTNAYVLVNGEMVGETPLTVNLKRNKNNLIQIELEGYEKYELVTSALSTFR